MCLKNLVSFKRRTLKTKQNSPRTNFIGVKNAGSMDADQVAFSRSRPGMISELERRLEPVALHPGDPALSLGGALERRTCAFKFENNNHNWCTTLSAT